MSVEKLNESQQTFMFGHKKNFDLSPRLKVGVGRGYSHNQILKLAGTACLAIALVLTANAVKILFSADNQNNSLKTGVLGASDVVSQGEQRSVEYIDYKIEKGDTLFNISQKYNVNWTTLTTLNNLKAPFTLKPGQIIKIPK